MAADSSAFDCDTCINVGEERRTDAGTAFTYRRRVGWNARTQISTDPRRSAEHKRLYQNPTGNQTLVAKTCSSITRIPAVFFARPNLPLVKISGLVCESADFRHPDVAGDLAHVEDDLVASHGNFLRYEVRIV